MHTLEPNEQTLHSYFWRELPPVLSIDSGETIRLRALDAAGNFYDPDSGKLVRSPLLEQKPLEGHALCGPVELRGARPGMTLAVEIGEIVVSGAGWNRGGGPLDWDHWQKLGVAEGEKLIVDWTLDPNAGTGTSSYGARVKLSPFLGVMGMPPDDPQKHNTAPPRVSGGNIDCKRLVSGSTLYLPIPVEGALFSAGDGHAAQGDGEASGTAIECPIERADLTLHLLPDLTLTTPRAKTPDAWLTFGFHQDLDEAMYIALNAMLDLLMEQYGLIRKEALSLASVVVDLHITQVVNGVQGVHALLPDGAVERV